MLKLSKKVAFGLMIKHFGPWKTWDRAAHIAYGLIRGVPYSRMERCSNDNPRATMFDYALWKLGAWPDYPYIQVPGRFSSINREHQQEALSLVVWVKKQPRVKHVEVEAAQ
jgi:hypothetical protein